MRQAGWRTLRFPCLQLSRLRWKPGWNGPIAGKGIALADSSQIAEALQMLGPLVLGLGDATFLNIPASRLLKSLENAFGSQGSLPCPACICLAPPLRPEYWSHQYAIVFLRGVGLQQLREYESTGGVAALVTGPKHPHPLRFLAVSASGQAVTPAGA